MSKQPTFVKAQVEGLPFLRLNGGTPKVGSGTLYTYSLYVEREVNPKLMFAATVAAVLADRRGWTRSGKVAFQRLARGGATQVCLVTPETVDKLCVPLRTEGEVSCCVETKVVINLERWLHAVPHWTGTVHTYRQMLVNHEWGHRIGHGHGYCPGDGARAPVMQQQTYGLQGCRANSWPLKGEL